MEIESWAIRFRAGLYTSPGAGSQGNRRRSEGPQYFVVAYAECA
jgi:hypothetical protein